MNGNPPDSGPPTVAGLEAVRAEAIRWVADTRFALDQITRLSRERGSKFYGKMDLARIGAFGHSLGGQAAVRLCQVDFRVHACLNQDGEIFGTPAGSPDPIPSVIAGKGTEAPVAVMYVAEPGFTDAQLTAVKVTRKQFEDWRAAKNAALRSFLNGNSAASYLITIKLPGYVHASFMDIRQLGTVPDAQAADNLRVGIDYTLSFFDAHLMNKRQGWNDLMAHPKDGITVEPLGTRRVR